MRGERRAAAAAGEKAYAFSTPYEKTSPSKLGGDPVRKGVPAIEAGMPLPASLLRASAPVPIPPCAWGETPRSRGLCRWRSGPAGRGTFPPCARRICSGVPGPLPRRLVWCTYPCLPTRRRPAPRADRGGAGRLVRAATSARPRMAGLQSCTPVQARRLVCHSGRSSPRRPRTLGRHGVALRASHGSFPPRAPARLAVCIGPWTAEDLHLLRFAALSAAPRTPAVSRRQWPERRRSGATVLVVKGAFVYFVSSAPPEVAKASDASAWREE